MRQKRRYLRQRLPWIAVEDTDLRAAGDPETVVFLPGARGSIVGLRILGLEDHVMIGIREDADGHPQSCAITNELQIDTSLQSNPKRHVDPDDHA